MKKHVVDFARFSMNESMSSGRPILVMTVGAGESLAGLFNSYEEAKDYIINADPRRSANAEMFQDYVEAVRDNHRWHVEKGYRSGEMSEESLIDQAWNAMMQDAAVYFTESTPYDIVRGIDSDEGTEALWEPPQDMDDLTILLGDSMLDGASKDALMRAMDQRDMPEDDLADY
jgi:hypothetical protein